MSLGGIYRFETIIYPHIEFKNTLYLKTNHMIDFIGKNVLISDFVSAIEKLFNLVFSGFSIQSERRIKLVEALTAINQAIIETKKFIRDEGFIENSDLSKLWRKALGKATVAGLGEGLPAYLYQKANFWGEPSDWIENEAALEIVPRLDYLKDICDDILVRINN